MDRLQADHLVGRNPHPTDRRTTLVAITPAGRKRLEAAIAVLTAVKFALTHAFIDPVAAATPHSGGS